MVNDTAHVLCVVRSSMTTSTRYDEVPDGRTAIPSTLWLMASFCKTSLMAVAAIRAASSLKSEFKKLHFLSRQGKAVLHTQQSSQQVRLRQVHMPCLRLPAYPHQIGLRPGHRGYLTREEKAC